MDIQKYLKESFKSHFEECVGEVPTQEQLKFYMDFHLEKENDKKKFTEICGIDFNEGIEARLGRAKRKELFKTLFGFEPNEEQLDVFIACCFYGVADQSVLVETIFSQYYAMEEQSVEPGKN